VCTPSLKVGGVNEKIIIQEIGQHYDKLIKEQTNCYSIRIKMTYNVTYSILKRKKSGKSTLILDADNTLK
jgi:plasmid maintenance system killer protein